MSVISELGSMLDLLRTRELDAVAIRPFAGRFRGRDAEIARRYGVRRAMSGLLWHEVDVVAGETLCLPSRETDFTLAARLPLHWARSYASGQTAAGILGAGWRVRWEVTLRQSGDRLVYTDEHGRAIDVPCPQRGARVTVLSERLNLACLSDGTMVVADLTPSWRVFDKFDADGVARLRYIEEIGGERIGCIWEPDGRLARLGGTSGHELLMHYDGDGARLTAIESVGAGPRGILARYGYDDDGLLARVEDRCGAITRGYAYRDGRMVEQTGALGGVTRYAWETDGARARLAERSTETGARERFGYDAASRTTDVTDVFGNTARWRHDARGCVIGCHDFDGRAYAFQYGRSRWPVALELPGGRRIELALDNLARVVRETDSRGQWRQTNYAFGTLEPQVVKLASGEGWTWERNERLQVTQYQTPDGGGEIGYDERGWVVRHADARAGTVRLERDAAGRVTRQIDAQGHSLSFTYGPDGHVAEIRDALDAVTRFECNALGWPGHVIRPDGGCERHGWNALGQRTSCVGADGQTRTWERDARGRVVREINEEGHAIEHEYDAHGRRVRTTSGNGAVQTFEYDAAGRLAHTVDENGVARAYTYTDGGAVATLAASAGGEVRRETFGYDGHGRLVARETAHSHYRYGYTAAGRLESAARTPTAQGEALGIVASTVRFTYDERGRIESEEGAHGKLRYAHDGDGRLIGVLLPQEQTLQVTRDDDGAVTLIGFDGQLVAEFGRDAMKRETVCLQGDLLTYIGYDAVGAPVWWRAVLHSETAGRELTSGDLRIWRAASYGPGGKVVQTSDHRHGETYLDHDRSGNLLRRVADDIGIERFSWDGSGTLVDPLHTVDGPVLRGHHRLPGHAGWQYDYDAWGRVIGKSGNRDAQTLDWDAEGHLLAVRARGRRVRYEYDALGRCVARTVEAERAPGQTRQPAPPRTVRLVWQDDIMIQQIEADRVRTCLYRPTGTGYVGEVPLALIDQTLDAAGKPASTRMFHYQADVAGTAVALTDAAGAQVWSARYTALGRLLAQDGEAGPDGQPLRLAGQFADDETGLHWHGRRVFDPDIGRYLSPERRDDGTNPYAYAPAPARAAPYPCAQAPDMADAHWRAAESARLHASIAPRHDKAR